MRYGSWTLVLVFATLAGAAPRDVPTQPTVEGELRRRIETLRATGALTIDGRRIGMSEVLAGVYERRGFAPLWSDPARAAELGAALRGLAVDGLPLERYHVSVLGDAARRDASGVERRADLDLLRTHALLRAAHDLRFGSVDATSLRANTDLDRPLTGGDALAAATALLEAQRLTTSLNAYRPTHFVYTGLVAALVRMRDVERRGGWQPLAAGPTLRRDSVDARVPALRRRLVLAGDLAPDADTTSMRFDATLESAVMRFQHRHALNDDGVVGPATLSELNVPVETRVDQIRINLERARWVTHDLEDSFVAVNIAGAMVYLVRAGDVRFETRAIVGRTYTRTPVFSATMRYIDLNPTWTVPPSIVGEVLAQVRRDPGYLRQQNITVLNRSGREVNPSSIDFARYSGATFPYVFRQEPGPLNALGRIKLMFPNRHNVYLHDTPARQLFAQEQRMFSHGCIRVQDPLRLAALVLDDPQWTEARLSAAIEAGRTRTITLARPLPVLVLYWTASADLHGELHFYRDVYGRDGAVLRGLDSAS